MAEREGELLSDRSADRNRPGLFGSLGHAGIFHSLGAMFHRQPQAAPASPREQDLRRMGHFYAALLAMASHDLRQPLQTILGMHALLGRRLTEPSEREFLERGEQ